MSPSLTIAYQKRERTIYMIYHTIITSFPSYQAILDSTHHYYYYNYYYHNNYYYYYYYITTSINNHSLT